MKYKKYIKLPEELQQRCKISDIEDFDCIKCDVTDCKYRLLICRLPKALGGKGLCKKI